ncbi:hypothetical protein SAMN06265368_4143 [Cohaesibacter gelatinilyticus]|uniref:Uncharacterized protein n=1 Tax=Cohaesibacter gelatinilyticus TaxID=372072 RepID=A0A285PH31_9HYPH|nr:hypothetical protein SAMN06265368_4143 [Cohaesibacter gelatinilyticus]
MRDCDEMIGWSTKAVLTIVERLKKIFTSCFEASPYLKSASTFPKYSIIITKVLCAFLEKVGKAKPAMRARRVAIS